MLSHLDIAGGIAISASNGTHSSSTPCVTIKDSIIHGDVDNGLAYQPPSGDLGPLVMTDDTVSASNGDIYISPVTGNNYYAWRLNVVGGRLGFACVPTGGYCEVHDSWVHDGYLTQSFHYNAFGTNGNGGNPIILDHNSLFCTFGAIDPNANFSQAGCSDDIGMFGDFASLANITVGKNLLGADGPASNYSISYCFDGGGQTGKPFPTFRNEVVTNNVFQRGPTDNHGDKSQCGVYGPVYAWITGNGNVWSGNTWDDGTSAAHGALPVTKITRTKIKRVQGEAKFSFNASSGTSGFQCALIKRRKHYKTPLPHFVSCKSPKTVKHLKHGTYTFEVRALSAAGAGTPASTNFKIG